MGLPMPISKMMPAAVLAVYSSLMAVAFYYIEDSGDCPMPDFWTSMYFVGTVYTTIGYGTVWPCTDVGKGLTILFALTSFPIALITLDNIGYLLAKFFSWLWYKMKSCMCSSKISPEEQYQRQMYGETLPLPLGLLMTFAWIIMMCVFFILLEDLNVLDSVYFVFISITTIGFGDIAPTKMEYVVLDFAVLMIGLALFSMCVNLIQASIENLVNKIIMQIMKDYQKSLEEGKPMDEAGNDDELKKRIKGIIKKQPGGRFIQPLMGGSTMDTLMESYRQKSKMRVVGTQVEITYADQYVDCTPRTASVPIQAEFNINQSLRFHRPEFDDQFEEQKEKYDANWRKEEALQAWHKNKDRRALKQAEEKDRDSPILRRNVVNKWKNRRKST